MPAPDKLRIEMANALQTPAGYAELLQELKARIHAAQVRAAQAVSHELVLLYWSIGKDISERSGRGLGRQDCRPAGPRSAERVSRRRGLQRRAISSICGRGRSGPSRRANLQQLVAQLPWGHNIRVLDRLKDRPTREWYLRAALEYGWSRNILVLQISSRLHEREGKALTNFQRTLPPPGSDLAEQILKDPYNFDFLTVAEDAHEREIERGLLIHLRDLLLELGRGFAFVGSQVPLAVGEETFYIDLLFYHVRLHAFIVIELKTGRSNQSGPES
jgi:predicted nuclease of restriction endonuclease-like (RecB) superfamily